MDANRLPDDLMDVNKLPDGFRKPNDTAPLFAEHGTVATITCEDGYNLKGSENTTCDLGNWTNEAPTCVESKFVHIFNFHYTLSNECMQLSNLWSIWTS